MGTISIATIFLAALSGISSIGFIVLASMLSSKNVKDAEERKLTIARDARIAELEKSFITAENTFVTNSQLKLAIREAFEPYKEDNKEIKLMLRSVSEELVNISRDLAVINAIGRSSNGTGYYRSDSGGTE